MRSAYPDTALIIAEDAIVMRSAPILGTGGWLQPEEREALDWMTLIKFLGWQPLLLTPNELELTLLKQFNVKWIILIGEPDDIDSKVLKAILLTVAKQNALFVSRAGRPNGNFAEQTGIHISDRTSIGEVIKVKGLGIKSSLKCGSETEMPTLETDADSSVLASLSSKALIAAKNLGSGKMAALSFHPSDARDQEGVFTVLLKNLLIYQSAVPVAWMKWENTVVLRMDDPGSAEQIYNSVYRNGKLGELEWEKIGKELSKRNGRMTVGYVSGWVDDGNANSSILEVYNTRTERIKGKIYPSPSIKYSRIEEDERCKVYDYCSEFSGLQKLVDKDIVDIAVHGFIHVHPNIMAWVEASDRYSNNSWYREFSRSGEEFLQSLPENEHPFWHGVKAVSNYFKQYPTAFISPGEEFTDIVILKALKARLKIISSYYLGIRIKNQFCWVQHICAPYLTEADPKWFVSELPVVGYFHDFDVSINGLDWFAYCLNEWENAGAKSFISFKEVASLLDVYISMQEEDDTACLNIIQEDQRVENPVAIGVFLPATNKTFEVSPSRNESLNFKMEFNSTNEKN